MTHVLLLRGINVGKSVQVPMVRLKALLEELDYTHVTTYLNSGNALLESDQSVDEVTARVEAALALEFGQRIPTLVKSGADMVQIADALPAAWQNDETQQTYVAYLFPEARRPEVVNELPIKREFVEIVSVHDCLIWNIARVNYNKSRITKLVSHPLYAAMTTRNANSARKLAELCRARQAERPGSL